jgi:hypothetical protein
MFPLQQVTLIGLALAVALGAAEPGIKAQFAGGTVAGVASKCGARPDFTGGDSPHFECGKVRIEIPYRKVNTLEYGQNVSRRYMEAVLISPVFLLAKSRRHYVTLGYVDAEGRQQALVIRIEKGDIRSVLTGLEARTGRRVEYQDSEARKAGKG